MTIECEVCNGLGLIPSQTERKFELCKSCSKCLNCGVPTENDYCELCED